MTTKSQNKDVVYIDVDDEITSIIGKLHDSPGQIVALVLPKRAVVLQSIVNLKLLKRTADETKKNLVLITSEASLLPLAGVVGVHVAKTLQSKPAVPSAPQSPTGPIDLDDTDGPTDIEELDATKPVGELAGMPPTDDDETIEVDNDDEVAAVSKKQAKKDKKTNKAGLNKKLMVPNFESFRTRIFLALGAVVLLLIIWFIAFRVMPKALITIKTDNTTVASNLTITASPTAKELNEKDMIVPGQVKKLKKTDSQKVPATGQKDAGTKASGTVTLSLNDCSQPQVTIPAGTTVSSGNLNFKTQVDVTLQSVKIGLTCRNSDFKEVSTAKAKVEAASAGDQYNLSARNYAVAGYGNVSGAGTAMAGGTSKIIKIVSQQDVDSAKQKALDATNASAGDEVTAQLKAEGYIPIVETLSSGDPLITATPNVGDEAAEVTVNTVVTYEMTGAKQEDVKKLLEDDIKRHIDSAKQNILDNGLEKAVIHATDNKKPNGEVKFTFQTNAQAGVQQNPDEIREAIKGMKKGEVQEYILARPGVKDVEIKYSPMWIYKTPKSINKITVTFQQADGNTSQ